MPLRVTRLSVLVPPVVKTPPPSPDCPAQVLLLTVTSVRDRSSVLAMPPPFLVVVFCVTTTLLRFRVATFVPTPPVRMPPPEPVPGLPLRIVTPEIVVAPLANTSNTRSVAFPSMLTLAAAAPVMVTASVTSRSPVAAWSSSRPAMLSV